MSSGVAARPAAINRGGVLISKEAHSGRSFYHVPLPGLHGASCNRDRSAGHRLSAEPLPLANRGPAPLHCRETPVFLFK